MPHIRSVFFWLNGVIAPHLWELTRDVLASNGVETGPGLSFALIDLDHELARGAIGSDEYCARAVELASAPLSPPELAAAIEGRLAVTPGILGLLDELADRCRLCLLADLPHRWLLPLLQQPGLAGRFSDETIVMTGERGARDASAGLLEVAVASPAFLPDETLLIDADWLRAVAALRAGLYATIFVDATRLRRDLGLWGLLSLRQ